MWLNRMQKLGLHIIVKRCCVKSAAAVALPKELLSRDEVAEPERVKVCGTCRGTLARFKGHMWIEDFRRAVDCLCGFRKSEFEIVLTRRVVEALCVITKLANSKVYCYRERCWVRLLEPA